MIITGTQQGIADTADTANTTINTRKWYLARPSSEVVARGKQAGKNTTAATIT